jgi:hypothetical protein
MSRFFELRHHGLSFLLGVSLSLIACLILPHSASAATAFNYTDHLMDDSVFRASDSMTAQDIQSFLLLRGSGLTNFSDVEDCGSPSGSHYSYYATYYACGQRASAAQIIYAASQAYGINPKVIIATLQKEQSLITTPNPTASQLNFAMGYGCPDSGSCSYPGFFNQVDNGAWQFRTDMELGAGQNWWGYTPASYPCNGATRYYSAALKAGNGVTFKDDNGTAYTSFVIPNMSTATLYCYTPHVYNNPSGLFGNPPSGSTGSYYSGSYNFVHSFNLWFVPYSTAYYSQTPYPTLKAGQSSQQSISYRNTGSFNWYDDTTASANSTQPVHLAVSNPVNSTSPFSYNWPSAGRPAVTFSNVYLADGVTLAANQHVVQPGEIAKFAFNITVPYGFSAGAYRTYFQPVLEGASNWDISGGTAWIDTTVTPTINAGQYYNQQAHPSLKAGQAIPYYFRYKNTGNTIWYDDTTASANSAQPVHLAVWAGLLPTSVPSMRLMA